MLSISACCARMSCMLMRLDAVGAVASNRMHLKIAEVPLSSTSRTIRNVAGPTPGIFRDFLLCQVRQKFRMAANRSRGVLVAPLPRQRFVDLGEIEQPPGDAKIRVVFDGRSGPSRRCAASHRRFSSRRAAGAA
jgi:hypothetical protein